MPAFQIGSLKWEQPALVVKCLSGNAGDIRDTGLSPGLGWSPGIGNGNSNILAWNILDRRTWRATVHGVTKSQTWLSTHRTPKWISWKVEKTARGVLGILIFPKYDLGIPYLKESWQAEEEMLGSFFSTWDTEIYLMHVMVVIIQMEWSFCWIFLS